MAIVAAVGLVSTACGARVPFYVAGSSAQGVQEGSSAGPGGTGPMAGTGSVGGATTDGAVQGGPGASTGGASAGAKGASGGPTGGSQVGAGTGSSAPGGVTAANMTPANFPFNPAQQAALCTGTSGNTASGPGVTPTSITVGNVSGISGLIPNSFAPGYQAVLSAFDAVNRYGGICGRQLKLDVEDDQQNASNNQADVQDLIPKVLAFVGSLSDADNGGVNAMVGAGVPDMGPAINANRSNSNVYWSATGGSLIERNGGYYIYNTWLNGLKANHDLPSSIGILSYSISISQTAGQQFASAFQQAGVKICFTDYNIEAGAQATSIPSDVAQMKAKGCGGVYTTMDVVGNANMLDAMQNQDWHPQLISTTYEGYSPDQISSAGQQAAQGLQVALNSVPLNEPNPGVQMYQQELNTYEPGNSTSEFGLEAWADAEMFIYALLKTGRNPTRASLVNALSQISGWTTDGAFGPYAPRDRTGLGCASDVIVSGNSFVTDWPSSGLYCNAQLIRVGNA
jgi:ABC-type branched-subunit amino acid transport system substrate-binding protein